MNAKVRYEDVSVGQALPDKEVTVDRLALLLFGGQTMRLDFAATHWSERISRSVGLPDVIMHGPFTLGKVLEIVNGWTGDPGALLEHRIRLARPVPVPDDETGAVFRLSGTVEEKLPGNRVRVGVSAASPEGQVLATLQATVQLG
ncbi:MaoC/PaaZ C-terminal domain-containing protein [Streptomyces sp. NBC_00322]|uniref:MaoC/PaaZ C-terminal domain-containing protein n=1 Tax=Streptomyces sp. NBC_00322 TaxID=2975712 RepID=UPI002E2A7CFB|nr:MaoC/PaaZ C-terminal domain-containing protein [Streptomyces sp. NBC_00322]